MFTASCRSAGYYYYFLVILSRTTTRRLTRYQRSSRRTQERHKHWNALSLSRRLLPVEKHHPRVKSQSGPDLLYPALCLLPSRREETERRLHTNTHISYPREAHGSWHRLSCRYQLHLSQHHKYPHAPETSCERHHIRLVRSIGPRREGL